MLLYRVFDHEMRSDISATSTTTNYRALRDRRCLSVITGLGPLRSPNACHLSLSSLVAVRASFLVFFAICFHTIHPIIRSEFRSPIDIILDSLQTSSSLSLERVTVFTEMHLLTIDNTRADRMREQIAFTRDL